MSERRIHAFDLDDTLVPGSLTVRAFWRLIEAGHISLPAERLAALSAERAEYELPHGGHHPDAGEYVWKTVLAFVDGTRGLPVRTVRQVARELAEVDAQHVYPEMQEVLDTIHKAGETAVVVSASVDIFVQAFAQRIGASAATGSRFYTQKGAMHPAREPKNVAPKDQILRAVCANLKGQPYAAYGDSMSDVPMLTMVEHPYAVNPTPELRTMSEKQGWTIIDCSPPLPNQA